MINLKETRESLGLTVSGMARTLGVHRNTYDKWERGEHTPPAVAVRFIAYLEYQWAHERQAMYNTLDRMI